MSLEQGAAVFCKYHPDRKSTRIVGHGHGAVCEECWNLICVGKNPAPTRMGDEPEPVMNEKCHCGRAKGHTGRHIGSPSKVSPGQPKATPRKPLGKLAAASGRFADAISQLKDERERIDRVIADLESMN